MSSSKISSVVIFALLVILQEVYAAAYPCLSGTCGGLGGGTTVGSYANAGSSVGYPATGLGGGGTTAGSYANAGSSVGIPAAGLGGGLGGFGGLGDLAGLFGGLGGVGQYGGESAAINGNNNVFKKLLDLVLNLNIPIDIL